MRVILVAVFAVLWCTSVFAQSPTGSIGGIVFDPDAKTIPGAEIIVVNESTRVQYETKTNDLGIYTVPNLPPGPYRVQASRVGFKTLIKPGIILNVQDAITVNFTLPIGATSVAITVEGGAPMINTTDGSLSTVVDQNFVRNMPLNGRSFQDLILLTPGIVTNSPQTPGYIGTSGEFSVNGQRTDSNYYSLDGVGANLGTSPGGYGDPATNGGLPASTALGTTQGLVSVDALEEFRVQSSTYSAEYGRNPGGQFSFVTRSGTGEWHGTGFDYIRNSIFDANDWFNNYYAKPEPALRQNDFGGTLGGPVRLPKLYGAANKTFFFFSYEGLRLMQPQAASPLYVPSLALRQSAPAALQPALNTFPLPNCPPMASNCSEDLGNGLGESVGTWSNPSSIDSYGIRLDESVNANLRIFFRYSDSSSRADTRRGSEVNSGLYHQRSYTAGVTSLFRDGISNAFRLNYSSNDGSGRNRLDDFGGASGVELAQLQGINTSTDPSYSVQLSLLFPGYNASISQFAVRSVQRQWNFVDTTDVSLGRHQFKFGADYRRLTPTITDYSPGVYYYFYNEPAVEANEPSFGFGQANTVAHPLYRNFSAFAQDNWRLNSRLTLSLGLRWEVNPAPGSTEGPVPYTVEGTSLSTLRLAPAGTPLWRTTWYDFAPRLGVAYQMRTTPGWETVVRGGVGVFYDSGQQSGSAGYLGPGFATTSSFGSLVGSPLSFPAPLSRVVMTPTIPPTAPYSTTYAYPEHRQLPYTLQWNTTVQQALGSSQVVTISYVGAHSARLLQLNEVNVAPFNPNFQYVYLYKNGLTADYDSLQVQFQRRLQHGLQVLASYTFAHAIDYGSQTYSLPYQRGNADMDVRHNFSAALSYDGPANFRNKVMRSVFGNWGVDGRITARTGFPVTLEGPSVVDPATGNTYASSLNLVPGATVYLYGPQYPGGRAINSAAFQSPGSGEFGNAPRNFVRGFGASQVDLALRRDFVFSERWKLQFRAEAFNLFNHPNFGQVDTFFYDRTFGQATATLAQSLGVLSPLYQMGGPRSMQLALKVVF